MDGFADALISTEKSCLIPDEYDYWKDVIGSWDLDFVFNQMFSSVPRENSGQNPLKNMARL